MVALLAYGYYQAGDLLHGPQLLIHYPKNGASIDTQLTEIKGTAQNISKITLNDGQIFINESGAFTEQLLLNIGYNIITVSVEDRYGRRVSKTLAVVFKPNKNNEEKSENTNETEDGSTGSREEEDAKRP